MLTLATTSWAEAAPQIAGIAVGAVFLAFLLWQGGRVLQARTLAARADDYRRLAERATAAQEKTATELTELRTRLEGLERILKEVE